MEPKVNTPKKVAFPQALKRKRDEYEANQLSNPPKPTLVETLAKDVTQKVRLNNHLNYKLFAEFSVTKEDSYREIKRDYEKEHGVHLLSVKTQHNSQGLKEFCYECDQSEKHCKFKLKLITRPNQKIELWIVGEHNHAPGLLEKGEIGIPYLIKLKIYELVDNGKRPRKIHMQLLEEYASSCPEYSEVRNCVYFYKKTKLSEIMEKNKEEFDKWIDSHLIPNTDDECFVLDHSVNSEEFRMTVSSKTLLLNAVTQAKFAKSLVFVDSTYKIINSGLILMVMGTQTLEHQFRPIAFQISLQEDTKYSQKFFVAVKNGISEIINKDWEPEYLMSDFDEAISNAASSVFPHCTQLKCYFHLKKNVERKIREHGLKAREEQMLEDIHFVSEATTSFDFDQLSELLLKKQGAYKEDNSLKTTFVEYFQKQYLHKERSNWFIASSEPGIGNTNNAIESFNKSLKGSYFSGRLDIGTTSFYDYEL